MTAYKDWLQNILDKIEAKLKNEITGTYGGKSVEEITQRVRLTDAEYKFPRIDILPKRDDITDEYGIGNDRKHTVRIEIICALSADPNETTGAGDLVDLAGDVYDCFNSARSTQLGDEVEDIHSDTIEFEYDAAMNPVLYIGRVTVICEDIQS